MAATVGGGRGSNDTPLQTNLIMAQPRFVRRYGRTANRDEFERAIIRQSRSSLVERSKGIDFPAFLPLTLYAHTYVERVTIGISRSKEKRRLGGRCRVSGY